MYLRNYLFYNNVLYFLEFINLVGVNIWDYLKESNGFINDFQERESKKRGSPSWKALSQKLYDRIFRIDIIINEEEVMNFIEASNLTKEGKRVRRKSWLKGGDNSWVGSKRETSRDMWWDAKYECLLAGAPDRHVDESTYLDTKGWIYICRGTDMEATDWELAK